MAVLTDNQRAQLHAAVMRALSLPGSDPLPITKADSRAVINALDAWTDGQQAQIPQPARGV